MSDTPPYISRFAPSPTGYLHLGHLVNAIYVWGITGALGGNVILRLEDHDRGRCRPEYETTILEDLDWLGLQPHRGHSEEFRAGPTPFRQSDCADRYDAALAKLAARDLVYTCTCSRKEILARTGGTSGELRYDGHCRDEGYRPGVEGGTRLRLDAARISFADQCLGAQTQCPESQCGDLLLKDRHGCWTYHFAVTVDDWEQGVNLVIRGEDLLDSTGRQIQLATRLGRTRHPEFIHHPLISDKAGNKLSKRDFAKGLRDYRTEGCSPGEILGEAAWRVGLLNKSMPLEASGLPELFSAGTIVDSIRDRHGV
jgi:glutamyl-Q tRNA(Asp) synthetase